MNVTLENNKIIRDFCLKDDDCDKYIVFCVAKNEDLYIEEFVRHNLGIGFDKVIICDNNDNVTILPKILEKYINDGAVEILNFSGFSEFQVDAYNMFLKNGTYKWCAFIDVDEFIELNPRYLNISSLLTEINEDVLCLNWMMYGANGEINYRNEDVETRFKTPLYFNVSPDNMFFKSIVRYGIKNANFEHAHTCYYPGKYSIGGYHTENSIYQTSTPLRYKKAYIKHYYTKSCEEFLKKCDRGWPDVNIITKRNNLLTLENIRALEQVTPPLGNFSVFFFNDARLEEMKEIKEKYDVIVLMSDNRTYWNFLDWVYYLYKDNEDFTLIVDENIDDNVYNIVLYYSIITGNRLITFNNFDDSMFFYFFEKYRGKKNNTYYKLQVW